MLHSKQLNVFRLRLLPLFLIILFALAMIPNSHAVVPIVFRSFCHANGNLVTTLNCTLSNLLGSSGNTGDLIVVNIFGIGVFNSFSVTDGQSNTYVQKVLSLTANGAGASTYVYTAGGTITAGSDVVTVSTGGASRTYGFTASEYQGVVSFGVTGSDQQDSAGNSGSSTVTLTGTLGTSVMIDDFYIQGLPNTASVTASNGQTIRDSGFQTNCDNLGFCRASDGTSATLGWSWSGGNACPCFASHSSLELQAATAPLSTTTVSQCYGNCGNPAITLVNTNSTHSINFNQSITIFYQFQSNLNGVINNATTSIAKSYSVGTIHIAIYTIAFCPVGNNPFTSACPGSKVAESTTSPPTKTVSVSTRFSTNPGSSAGPVSAGQWVGIAISYSFSGLDLNDTNVSGPTLFQTNGITPSVITSSTATSCTSCKLGLWAWLTGNVVVGSPPPIPAGQCGNGIGDYLTCLTLTFCTGTPNTGCQLAGGLFWSMIYSVVGIVGLMWTEHKFLGREAGVQIPGAVYAFVPLGIQFMFISLGVLPVWWGILLIMVFTVLFTWMLLGFARGSGGRPT